MDLNQEAEHFFNLIETVVGVPYKEQARSIGEVYQKFGSLTDGQLKWVINTSRYQNVPIPSALADDLGISARDRESQAVRGERGIRETLNLADNQVALAILKLSEAVSSLVEAFRK